MQEVESKELPHLWKHAHSIWLEELKDHSNSIIKLKSLGSIIREMLLLNFKHKMYLLLP